MGTSNVTSKENQCTREIHVLLHSLQHPSIQRHQTKGDGKHSYPDLDVSHVVKYNVPPEMCKLLPVHNLGNTSVGSSGKKNKQGPFGHGVYSE